MASDATHADLVAMAVAWLRRGVLVDDLSGPIRCRPVLAEVVNITGEHPDAIGWHYGRSIVVECKVSRSDFFADARKRHAQAPTHGMGRYRYYLTPPRLIEPDEVPAWCGLAVARGRAVEVLKVAPPREIEEHAAVEECVVLASYARRHELRVRFFPRIGRFETADDFKTRRRGDAGKRGE